MAFTPCRVSGTILLSSLFVGWPSSPSISGTFGPVMSASSRPTAAPSRASATARFTATVLLPTPPLPDATASTFFTPGSSCSGVRGAARRTVAPQVSSTVSTPIGSSAAWTRVSISSLSGQAGRRQLDLERDLGAVDHEVPNHVPRDEVAAELRLLHLAQGLHHGGFGDLHHAVGEPLGYAVGSGF